MSRSERLFALLQVFRRHRRAVKGADLAVELGVSVRTVYRDIEALCRQGACIEGEAGVGYILKPGFLLPPLMLKGLDTAQAMGWTVVDMKNDWKQIFPFGSK